MQYLIDKNNRPDLVSEYQYGYVSAFNLQKYDKPVYATIEYGNTDEIIYEDYTLLDEFINKALLNNVYYKKDNPYISLKKLLSYKLSEIELKYTFNYLDKLGIKVSGDNNTFCKEFSNFEYFGHKKDMYPKSLSFKEMNIYLEEFLTTRDEKLREKIILGSMRYVKCILLKFCLFNNYNYDDLESYAMEGLIRGVDSFKKISDTNNNYYSYIKKVIYSYIIKGIYKLYGIKKYYKEILEASIEIEKQLKEKIKNNNDLIDLLYQELLASGYQKSNLYSILNIIFCSNYEDIDFASEENIEEQVIDDIIDEEQYLKLKNAFNYLSKREKEVITLKYGINTEEKSVSEISDLLNISKQVIYLYEEKALEKMKLIMLREKKPLSIKGRYRY